MWLLHLCSFICSILGTLKFLPLAYSYMYELKLELDMSHLFHILLGSCCQVFLLCISSVFLIGYSVFVEEGR